MKLFFSIFCIFIYTQNFAQKIYGTVFNSQGDLLPYASITIKGTTKGTSANDKAKYALQIGKGTFTVLCQNLGYTAFEKTVTVTNDLELSFVLTQQKLSLETVVINSNREDPAYEVIRNAIKKRNFYNTQVEKFTCNIYNKDLIKLDALPKKVFGRKIPDVDRKEMGLDSTGKGIVYLSESVSKISVQKPDKVKLEVVSSRVSGSDGFGFNFPTFISLYKNNVVIFTERFNPRGFISPIADGAIGYYKFKLLGTFYENGKSINTIKVTPRRAFEPLFSGIINIVDDEWSIYSFDLLLTKKAQLEILDSLQITQLHVAVDKDVRRVKNQLLHFNFNVFGIKSNGNFLTVYSDYDVKPAFGKKYFDNVIMKYDTGVNKKTAAYWDTVRAVPLEKEEELDYQIKDSTYKANKDSLLSKNTIDSLNKNQPKIKPFSLFSGGINRRHLTIKKVINYGIEGIINNSQYNPAEGLVLQAKLYYSIYKRNSRTGVRIEPVFRYGLSNTHLNVYTRVVLNSRTEDSARKIKRYTIAFAGGKRVSEFNKQGAYLPLYNTISTLFYGQNYLKTYENYFGSISFGKRYESGLQLTVSALYEDRIPLQNTSDFTLIKSKANNIRPNFPTDRIATQFTPHQAVITSATVSFKPGQRYIQFPNYKAAIGSKYPTFTLYYTKGINSVFGSDVNFDKYNFTIQDDKNLKLAGTIKYKIGVGGFLNNKAVYIQDFQHFNGNLTLGASEYVNSFQLAPYYANSTTASFYNIIHIEHHFNGLITNKIPLFRKLNWNVVAGTNSFYVNKNNRYIEGFAGLENIFKIFRVDVVYGYLNNNGKPNTGIRIGSGGVIGGGISRSGSGSTVTVSL